MLLFYGNAELETRGGDLRGNGEATRIYLRVKVERYVALNSLSMGPTLRGGGNLISSRTSEEEFLRLNSSRFLILLENILWLLKNGPLPVLLLGREVAADPEG